MNLPLNHIFHADCMEGMKTLPDKSIDLVVTDIPYGVVNRPSNGLRNLDKKDADTMYIDIADLMRTLLRVTKGSMYVFCGTEQVSEIRAVMAGEGMTTRLCIWEKTNPSPMNGQYVWLSGVECCVYGKFRGAVFNEYCKNTVFRYPCGRNKLHPTQKPLDLIRYLIETSSNPGDVILDPFMGSGTTAVACLRSGRNYIGYEISGKYHMIAERRIQEERERS